MAQYDSLSNSCKCIIWYTIYNWQCVSKDNACKYTYWYSSKNTYWTDNCECIFWYTWGKDVYWNKKCVNWDSFCITNFGINSQYDNLSDSCKCKNWYIVENNTCVEKENNVYFWLLDFNYSNKEAIIYDIYNKVYYYVKYNLGCISFKKYIWKNIVINLWKDLFLNIFDKIVLQDDNETCDIIFKKQVNKNYMINCPDMTDGFLEDWKCYCNEWYIFSENTNKCELNTKNINSIEDNAYTIFLSIKNKLSIYSDDKKTTIYNSLLKKLNSDKANLTWYDLMLIERLIYLINKEIMNN